MKKAYVSDNGLPRSVATTANLPANGFVGATVYCEGDQNLYVFTGEEYAAVGGGGGGGGGTSGNIASTGQLPLFDKVGSLPAAAALGTLAYVESTAAAYLKVGQTWKKLAFNES
jgi:hypothetical protein